MKRVYVNEEWCLGCHLCEYNCAFANSGKRNMAAALQNIKILSIGYYPAFAFDNLITVNHLIQYLAFFRATFITPKDRLAQMVGVMFR